MATNARLHNSHQAWLCSAYTALRKRYLPKAPDPKNVICSYGFPKGMRGQGNKIGQCWSDPVPSKRKAVIFIHPSQWDNPINVLATLLHEQIHAEHPKEGHKGLFKSTAQAVGLTGKMTATIPSPALAIELKALAKKLPTFPKAAFNPFAAGKAFKGSPLRRWICKCGIKVRVASDDFKATCDLCKTKFKHIELPGRKPVQAMPKKAA